MQVVVGRVGRPHGTRGDVSVEVRTDEPDRRLAVGSELYTDPARPEPLVLQDVRAHSGRLLAHFEGIDTRTDVEQLRGALLLVDVDPEERPDDPEEFYDRQIVGLVVVDELLGEVGRVSEVIHLPGQDLLAVDRASGPQLLVPFVHEIVPEVDLDSGRLSVRLPQGLLDLDHK
jgi:16S rRNA processing protein RimM